MPSKHFLIAVALVSLSGVENLSGQIVHLPTTRFFGVRSTVVVPDGGSIVLGGIDRASNQSRRGGLILGRPFRHSATANRFNSYRAIVQAKVVNLADMETKLLAELRRQRMRTDRTDPNGPLAIQKQADFISRHIGRANN